MTDKIPNLFAPENGWLGTNVGPIVPQVNFQTSPSGAHNFTNTEVCHSQNYPATNINLHTSFKKTPESSKINPQFCSPYNAAQAKSFDICHTVEHASKQNTTSSYNQAPVPSQFSNAHQMRPTYSPNNVQSNCVPESPLQENYVKHVIPPISNCIPKENTHFASGPTSQMSFLHAKGTFSSNDSLSNELENPVNSFPNYPAVANHVHFHNSQTPHNFSVNNNFQPYPCVAPTVPSRSPSNMPCVQTNCRSMYNTPPPIIHVGSAALMTDSNAKNPDMQHYGQFNFPPPVPPTNQLFSLSSCNDKPLPNNLRFQPQFNNPTNVMLPLPFHDKPPYRGLPVQQLMNQVSPVMQTAKNMNKINMIQMASRAGSEKENILTAFLQKFQCEKKMNSKSNVSVVEFRSTLRVGFTLSKMLQIHRTNLAALLHSSENEWETELKNVVKLRDKLSEVCGVLSIPSNLDAVQRKLKLIKKKRELKKKLKQEALTLKLKKEQEREILHQEIDKWLDYIKEKNLKLKREVEMKKEADNILSEVRRKILEAKRTIEKIKVFEKLRMVRQLNAERKGLFIIQEHTARFDEKIAEWRTTMLNQLSDYEAEERALKVMLETEREGQLEEEALWRIKKMRVLHQKKQKNIIESLFGESDEPSPDDPLFFFFQHQNYGNSSIDSLVQIRHQWDLYLSEEGEPIPEQWITPVPPSNRLWEDVCKD